MKVPKKGALCGKEYPIDVLGITFKVRFYHGALICDGRQVDGLCDHDSQTLSISGELCREAQRRTLIHEVAHVITRSRGMHTDEEEVCVRIQETGWYHFLRSPMNRWAVDFIMEKNDNGKVSIKPRPSKKRARSDVYAIRRQT